MDFELDADDVAVTEMFARFFERESPMDVVRAAEPSGFDRELWTKLTALGAPGVAVAPAAGGASLGQLAAIAEAGGSRLAPIPVVESLSAVRALSESALADSAAYAEMCGGTAIATLALIPIDRAPRQQVPAGAIADVVVGIHRGRLVVARPADHSVRRYGAVHGAIPMAEWTFDEARLEVVESPGPADIGIRVWKVLMAAALVGVASRAVALGAEYATQRKAFNTLIGTFQAVSHPLADGLTACEGARLLVQKASRIVDGAGAVDARLAAMAFAFATETARECTRVSTHIHGGYGASTEVDAQLCHSRAIAWPAFGPSPVAEYTAIGTELITQGSDEGVLV